MADHPEAYISPYESRKAKKTMNPTKPSKQLAKICTIIALVWMIIFAYFVCLTHITGPSGDDWNMMYFVKSVSENQVTPSILFEKFYGVHVIVLSRVLFSAEYFLFNGSSIFTKIIPLVALGATFLIFSKNIFLESAFSQKSKILLTFFGLIIIFSYRQLSAFNYALLGMQHVCAIFFASLAFHFFSQDTAAGKPITLSRLAVYSSLGMMASLFTVVGLFCLGAILIGLVIRRATIPHLLVYSTALLLLAFFFKPDNILLRTTDDINLIYEFTGEELLAKAGSRPQPFLPHFFIYIFAYFGAILEAISLNLSVVLGGFLLCIFGSVGLRQLFRRQPTLLFFQLFFYMAGTHAFFSAVGRYQSTDLQFSRFFSVYGWLIWAACVLAFAAHKKLGGCLCVLIAIFSFSTNHAYLKDELAYSYNAKKADINMINNSYPHMVSTKISTPLAILNFTPKVFHQFQKDRHWGIYRFPFTPDLSKTNNDVCEAIKTKEFIVSEKKFVEYQLDGWNLSRDKAIDYFYALEKNSNAIVAYGVTMPREPSLLPVFLLPREDVMIYSIIPRQYALRDLKLVGGNKTSFCEINLIKR